MSPQVEIFEDTLEQRPAKKSWGDLMTPEQTRRGEYYAGQYLQRKAELGEFEDTWNKLWTLYSCKRTPDPNDPDAPNSFVPILTPSVEGQTASIIETDVEFNYVTSNAGHEEYVKKLNPASKYNRRKSRFMLHMKDAVRNYLLLGNSWLTICWEKNLGAGPGQPSGYARIRTPSLVKVFVDGRIKDYKDLQYAEYIIEEIGFMSLDYARRNYGDKYADALVMGGNSYEGEEPQVSLDDFKGWTLLHVWTRNNEQQNLQLIEMDSDGLILRESDPSKPYYEDVDNEYPFVFMRGCPMAGNFYGFGDGIILQRFQETINCLFDEMEIAAQFSSQGRTFYDPAAELNNKKMTTKPGKGIMCNNPNQNIRVERGVGISNVVPELIDRLDAMAQKSARNPDIMSGIAQGSSATATQINGQLMQGSVGVRDKKSDISQAMEWADRYALKLCLEKWDKPFWAGAKGDRTFFDASEIRRVPATIGRTVGRTKKILDEKMENDLPFDTETVPEFEAVLDDAGEAIKIALDFDVEVEFGSGIPRGKNDMYNIILGLMQLTVMDEETGKPMPFLEVKRARELLTEFLGIRLTANAQDEEKKNNSVLANQIQPIQLNPVGDNGSVQSPQGAAVPAMAETQMANVPGTPGMDQRSMLIR